MYCQKKHLTNNHSRNQKQINLPKHSGFYLRINLPRMFTHKTNRDVFLQRDGTRAELRVVVFAGWQVHRSTRFLSCDYRRHVESTVYREKNRN